MRNSFIKFTRAFTLILLSLLCLNAFTACGHFIRPENGIYVITEYQENEYFTPYTTITVTDSKPEGFPEEFMDAYEGGNPKTYFLFEHLAEGVEKIECFIDTSSFKRYSVCKNGEWKEEALDLYDFAKQSFSAEFYTNGAKIKFTRQK